MTLKKIILLMSLLFLCSCSSGQKVLRDVTEVRHTPQWAEYLLPDLPTWANFDSTAQCMRDKSFHYVDLLRVQQSFSFSYKEAIELQAFYNRELTLTAANQSGGASLDLQEQAFFQALGKVQGNVAYLLVPEFKQIHFIWIDQALKSAEAKKRLKNVMSTPKMGQGYPIFVSLCHSEEAITRWLEEEKLDELGIRIVGAEMFSPFNEQGAALFTFDLDLLQLFPKDKQLVLFVPKESGARPSLWGRLMTQTW